MMEELILNNILETLREIQREMERQTELLQRIEGTSGELKQLTEALGKATSSLKSLKNPMKVKSATRSVSYVKTVLENATPELPYQAKLLGAIVSGK